MSQLFPFTVLASLPEPVLSVYLDTNPVRHLNRDSDHGCSRWFGSHAKQLLAGTGSSEQPGVANEIKRVEHFLKEHVPEARGIAIFAGPDVWHVIHLPTEPENEIHWGRPMLWQFNAIAHRQRPWCIAVVDGSGVRVFQYQHEELTPLATLEFHIDATHWKRMQAFHAAERNGGMAHGAQKDLFERRRETQYLRFLSDAAHRVNHLCEANGLKQVLLLGPSRPTRVMEQKLSPVLRQQLIQVSHFQRGYEAPLVLTNALKEKLLEYESDAQGRRVDELVNRSRAVVTGAEETLAMLQRGRLGLLMVEDGFNPILRYCTRCDHLIASSVEKCPQCQGLLVDRTLHETLPHLLVRHGCESELVSGKAAERLRGLGSIGGWLRQRQPISVAETVLSRGAFVSLAAALA